LGVRVDMGRYELRSDLTDPVGVRLTTIRAGGGYALLGGNVIVGLGTRMAIFDVGAKMRGRDLVSLLGVGVEGGVQLRFEGQPWALGVAASTPVSSSISLR